MSARPRQLESKAERETCAAALVQYGVDHIKLKKRGWPDRMYLIPGGRPLLIEWKREGEELRGDQKIKVYSLLHRGYDVGVCDTKAQGLEAIRQACEIATGVRGGRAKPAIGRLLCGPDWLLAVDRKVLLERLRPARAALLDKNWPERKNPRSDVPAAPRSRTKRKNGLPQL